MNDMTPYRDGLPGYYPHAPETSRQGAESIAPVASTIRKRVLHVVTNAGERGVMADDVADRLDLNVYQVRARLSELHADNLIADSKRRGIGASGRRCAVWVLPQYAPDPDDCEPAP